MSELIGNWINNEVELPQHVEDFEKDFSNGYLFARLLKHYKQLDDISPFSRKNNRDSRINNFILLEPIFRSLQIRFNAKQINDIIKEKRGSSLQLLCQLKMKLEKVGVPLDGHMSDTKPAKKLNPGKEKYDTQAHNHFKVQLQELNESQKNINLKNHLKKFEEIRQKQEAQAHREDEKEHEMKIKLKHDMRHSQIDKLQRNAGFMEEWLRKGIEDWKKNQNVKKEREKKQLQFEFTLTKKLESQTMTQINKAKSEVIDGIEEFENNLKRNGIETEAPGSKESSPSKTRLTINKSSNLFGRTNQTMTETLGNLSIGGKAKERGSRISEATRKERERRQGKLTKALNNDILRDMENKTREEQYIERLKRQSKQEEELNYEIWKTEQCKNVIIENRKLREARYYKRKELDTTNAISREEEMLRTLDEQRNIDEESQFERESDLRINCKQDQRKYRTDICSKMLDEIFEIANQAYILQQQTDSEEIDDRNWREWTKLFKTQESIKAAYVEGKPDFDEDDDKILGETKIDTEEESLEKAEFTLDDEELTDYLKSQGQWKGDLVNDEENKINMEQILNSGEATGGKGGKGAQPESKLDEDEMTIPEVLPKNNILGDVVEQVININYDGEKDIVRPEVPNHLTLRLAMVGKSFAGKKTQAQLIAEKYDLKQYHPFELIDEALSRSKEELEEIEKDNSRTAYSEEKEKRHDKEGEDEPEEEENTEEENQENKEDTPDAQAEGQKEPKEESVKEETPEENKDESKDAPEASEADHQEEDKKKEIVVGEGEDNIEVIREGSNEEILNVEAEFERKRSPIFFKRPMTKEEKLQKIRRNLFRTTGKRLEEILLEGKEIPEEMVVELFVSSIKADFLYKTQEEIDEDVKKIIEREEEIKEELSKAKEVQGKSFRNAAVIDEEALKKELEELANFNKFGWILVDFPCSLQQASRLEAQLSGYLPEIDKEICERNEKLTTACRIIEPSDKPNIDDTLQESGLDAVLWLDTKREECRRRALGRRIDLTNDTEFHIDDNPPPTTSPPLCERLMQVTEPERAQEVIPDKHLAFDNNTPRLRQWFSKFGYEKEGEEANTLELCHDINGDSANPEEVLSNATVLEKIVSRKEAQWRAKKEQYRQELLAEKERIRLEEEERIRLEEEAKRKAEEEAKKKEEGEGDEEQPEQQEPAPEEPPKEEQQPDEEKKEGEGEKEEEQEPQPPAKDNIDDDFAPVLMNIWNDIEEKYLKRMRKSFNLYRNQRNRITSGLCKTQKYFIQYLSRPDTKQAKLDEFVTEFNKFSDEYPDLREDEQTKEELHQRTDTLSDQLWEISEERRNKAVEERKKIMENGWAEFELEQVTTTAQYMFQAEVDKFRNCANLLQDYYYAIEDRLVPDPPEKINYEIINRNEDGTLEELPPVFETQEGEDGSKEAYPRLDKLFERGLKAQILPEVETTPPGGAAAGDKKGGKGKDAKKGGEEEVEEKYFYEEELQNAIKTEKAVLRFRLTMIRNWALSLMKEIRVRSNTCFQKLDTWIQVTFKAETDAIIEKEKVIKRSIEEETKLQHELKIKGMDFYLDEKFLNFEDPPPEVYAAREEPQDNRFTIKQLESLVNEFIVSSKDGLIKNECIVDLLLTRTLNSRKFSDENGVPSVLKDCDRSAYEMLIKAFDVKFTGFVSFKKVAITLCLLSSQVPSDEQLEEYKNNLLAKVLEEHDGSHYVGKNVFIKVPAWFDSNEISVDLPQYEPYPRVKNLKSILFDVVKTEDFLVNIEEFIGLLQIKIPERDIAIYGDIIKSEE
ncbi:unnamed protein product [Moneuplotes crassus]|uniref:Calponin-homology (CH) domain-containing protein n=3 Tax=Euplotes crassus TaxID=5936 RepID=A0AAD2DAN5_EUPCR|nr:unnamed protein product [Moneuplotes crassus]